MNELMTEIYKLQKEKDAIEKTVEEAKAKISVLDQDIEAKKAMLLTAMDSADVKVINDADKYLDLVALGTLADLVEMTPENRYLTRSGLSRLLTSAWPGVRELCRRQLENAPYVGGQDVLFRIAPLMNAPGRMDKPDELPDCSIPR